MSYVLLREGLELYEGLELQQRKLIDFVPSIIEPHDLRIKKSRTRILPYTQYTLLRGKKSDGHFLADKRRRQTTISNQKMVHGLVSSNVHAIGVLQY